MKMVNVSDEKIKVEISVGPGQEPMVTELEAGEADKFPDGYCKPVKSAGPAMLASILSRRYQKFGVPVLVPVDEEKAAKARFDAAKARFDAADKSPEATIRRLEAELAQAKAMAADDAKAKKAVKEESKKVEKEDPKAEDSKPVDPPEDDGMTPVVNKPNKSNKSGKSNK